MVQIESAWPKYPDYEINLAPRRRRSPGRGTATSCSPRARTRVRLEETKHVDRLYFPVEDVHWEHFDADRRTSPSARSRAPPTYWSLTAVDPVEKDIVWTYTTPFDEVGGIKGSRRASTRSACASSSRTRGRVTTRPPSPPTGSRRGVTRPTCSQLIDVQPAGDGHFVGPAYRDTTRNVVEGGQMLAQGIVAACEDAPPPARDAGVDVLPEGGRVRCTTRPRRRRPARGTHVLDRRGAGQPGRQAPQRGPVPPRRRRARRDRRQRGDARRRRTRRLRAVRHEGDRSRPADRQRRLSPRSRPRRTARAARMDPVPRRAVGAVPPRRA